jgi:glycine oxidase
MVDNDKQKKHIGHEVVIVGGGVIGLTIARSLALRGVRDICLLERSSIGSEASFAAAGMLAPQAEADSRDNLFELLCQGRDLYPTFASALKEETGIDIELDTTGTLYLAFTEDDQREIDERYEWQIHAGLPLEKLTPDDAQIIEPCIASKISGALRFPLDIQVENRRLLSALANSVAQLGVHVLSGINVESVQTTNYRVKGVESSHGIIPCSAVVIAAGAWTSFISSTIKVEPVRGQMICLTAKPQLTRHVIYSPRGYIVPRQDGRLLAGSTSEAAGFAKEVTVGGVTTILNNAVEIAPGISALPVVDSWAGLRPRAVDGLPVLGPCGEIEGLIYATGHYRNGILLAPITGELIAKTVVEGIVPTALAPFRPDRFAAVGAS